MVSFDLVIPWITFSATLLLLVWIQHWIHEHLFGVSYLIVRENGFATVLYFLILLPGVILHEASRYIMAGIFRISPSYVTFSPDPKEDGSFELGFVHFDTILNPFHGGIVGVAPLIAGMALVAFIGGTVLDLPAFLSSFGSGDINVIGAALGKLIGKPDFWLLLYILFGVSNTMMPSREDRRGWWIVGALFFGLILVLMVIGLYQAIINLFAGPVTKVLYALSSVFGVVLFLDFIAAILIGLIEFTISRITNRKVQYRPALPAKLQQRQQPIGPRSVYKLQLPLPPPPKPGQAPARLPAGGPAIAAPKAPSPAAFPATSNPALTPGRPEPDKPTFPARPVTPSLTPAKEASTGAEPLKPATPLTPSAAPKLTPTPTSPTPTGTPSSSPFKPASPTPASGPSVTPSPRPSPAPTPTTTPPSPFKPASPTPTGTPSPSPFKPAQPTPSVSGPPALTPRSGGLPVPAKPTMPTPVDPNRSGPPGKPAFGPPPNPLSAPKKPFDVGDDYIDADVIDEDKEEEDDEELKYEDLDET